MNPTDRRFDNWIFNTTVKEARSRFEEYGELTPIFTAYTDKEVLILPTLFDGFKQKRQMLKTFKLIFAVLDVEHYTVSHEAWCVICKDPKDRQDMPESLEHAPGRRESVCVMSINEKRKMYRMFEIKRENGKATLEDEMLSEATGIGGIKTSLSV